MVWCNPCDSCQLCWEARCCMAARGARAAGQASDHRLPGDGGRVRLGLLDRCLCAAAARTRLDHGRTVAIQYRWAEGRAERWAKIAAELARLKVDVIVTDSVNFLVS